MAEVERRLAAQIRRHIMADHPFGYCDGCVTSAVS